MPLLSFIRNIFQKDEEDASVPSTQNLSVDTQPSAQFKEIGPSKFIGPAQPQAPEVGRPEALDVVTRTPAQPVQRPQLTQISSIQRDTPSQPAFMQRDDNKLGFTLSGFGDQEEQPQFLGPARGDEVVKTQKEVEKIQSARPMGQLADPRQRHGGR